LVWTGFVVMAVALPTLLPAIAALFPRHAKITTRSHLDALWSDVVSAAQQTALLVVFLAHHAWLMADAIGRTLFRLAVSHRRLLEWITAAQSKQSLRAGWPGLYGKMAGSVVVALVVACVVWLAGAAAMPVAAPFVLAWLLAPAVAHWVSRPPRDAGSLRIKPAEAASLRLIARQTWRFFETFVTEADNMLPPDNFQEAPTPVVAHRTSPTNLGLLLLSTAAAREFGWIGTASSRATSRRWTAATSPDT
jgi:cyclic beta-1,2-glucan synthetase